MTWLLAQPPPPTVNKLDQRHRGRLRKRDNLLTGDGRKGLGHRVYYNLSTGWARRPHRITARKSGHLLIIQYSLIRAASFQTYIDFKYGVMRRTLQNYMYRVLMHTSRGSQRNVVYLGRSTAPSYMRDRLERKRQNAGYHRLCTLHCK
jgi:hypothetical protein